MTDYTQPFCILGSKGKFADCYQDYLPPLDYYFLDKKEEQPIKLYYNRGDTTNFTGRYAELPAIGRLEKRLKEVELKLENYQFKQKVRQEDGF